MASLNFNSGKNFIIPTENDMTYRGLGGDDIYIISKAIPSNTKIQIIDTEGSNVIQLIDGITISTSLFINSLGASNWCWDSSKITSFFL